MGIGYVCDSKLGCTFVVWDGDVTPTEWRDHVDRMFADPAFPPGPLVLCDMRTAGGAPSITEEALQEIGEHWSAQAPELPEMRMAIVPNGSWDKAKHFADNEISTSRLRFILFNDVMGASAWLGLDVAPVQATLSDVRTRLRAESIT